MESEPFFPRPFLGDCPVCHRTNVSSEATRCPRCGHPNVGEEIRKERAKYQREEADRLQRWSDSAPEREREAAERQREAAEEAERLWKEQAPVRRWNRIFKGCVGAALGAYAGIIVELSWLAGTRSPSLHPNMQYLPSECYVAIVIGALIGYCIPSWVKKK